MEEIKDKIEIFSNSIGLFVIADYNTPNGIDTAKGKLVSVSEEGDIVIRHLKDGRVSWGFNLKELTNYKFSPIKGYGGENGAHHQ